MYRGSVAPTETGGCGSPAASSAAKSWSRPVVSAARAAGRCNTMQAAGLCGERAMAASSSGLYCTTRPGSRPQEAVTITLGWASAMRAASSAAANPPNTTECTAPSRAQASIAIAASGTIGM